MADLFPGKVRSNSPAPIENGLDVVGPLGGRGAHSVGGEERLVKLPATTAYA